MLRPGFFKAINGRRLEADYDGHQRVERVQLVEAFGNFYEMRYHFASRLDSFAVENLFLAPERGLIEATRELNYVGRFHQLLS